MAKKTKKQKEKEQKKAEKEIMKDHAPDLPNEQDLRDTFFGFGNDDPPQQTDGENIAETIEAWLNDKYIHAKTRLTPNQVIALTILKTLSDKYNITCIQKLIENFVRYKLSEGGQSSKELVDILKNRQDESMDDGLLKAVEPFLK